MLRATPGCLRISPARSRVSTIWWVDGACPDNDVRKDGLARQILEDFTREPAGSHARLYDRRHGWHGVPMKLRHKFRRERTTTVP